MSQTVKVMVRCRPMNQNQKNRGSKSVIDVDSKNNQINLSKPESKEQPRSFSFDCVFGPNSLQSYIYEQSAFSLVDNVLDGYNGTIFAYGQTGCGKTHTMMGKGNGQQKGIIPRTFNQIITITSSDHSKTHLIRCSFIEIYNQEIHDLLGKDIKAKMQLKESSDKGVFVKDLIQMKVQGIQQMQKYMDMGFGNRAVRATNMNNQSSRSHSIFTIYIQSQQTDQKGNEKFKAAKLNLVDLAGSERASKTGTTGDGMKEAMKINLSLSSLGNVISALVDGNHHHIPYRDSKLTRLLQDSLGGNTKTIMIAAISPADYNYDQTLSTLRYASRAKFIKNKPKINEDPKDAQLRQMSQQIKKLKMMLAGNLPMNYTPSQGGEIKQRIIYKTIEGQNKQNNSGLQQQLRNKQQMLRNQQQQKQLLNQKLAELQQQFKKKQQVSEQNKIEMQKIKKLKQKLKLQKKKQQQYQKEKARRQSQLLNIQKNYKSLNQQVDQMRQRFTEIKKKYMANLTQLRDIQSQHYDEKQDLLDTIRYQQKQIKKFRGIIEILMNDDQLDMIIHNSDWNQQKRDWNIPNFVYRQRFIHFPKLVTGKEINQEKQRKQVIFRGSKKDLHDKKEDGFRMNQIVKNARQSNQYLNIPPRSQNYFNKAQLSPLKNDSMEKIRTVNAFNDQRKRKTDKLQPLQIGDSRKRL